MSETTLKPKHVQAQTNSADHVKAIERLVVGDISDKRGKAAFARFARLIMMVPEQERKSLSSGMASLLGSVLGTQPNKDDARSLLESTLSIIEQEYANNGPQSSSMLLARMNDEVSAQKAAEQEVDSIKELRRL
jgi:hypothetical protein